MAEKRKLRRDQAKAVAELLDMQAGLLHAPMGFGKTSVGATFIKQALRRPGVNRALIIAPMRVLKEVWKKELPLFGPWKPGQITLMSNRVLHSKLKDVRAQVVVIDEATTVTRGKNANALRRWMRKKPPPFRLPMTGTPLHRGLHTAWGLYAMVKPDGPWGYPTQQDYMDDTHNAIKGARTYVMYRPKRGALEKIAARAAHMTVYAEPSPLAVPCQTIERTVELRPEELAGYHKALDDMTDELGMPLTPGARLTKARQHVQRLKFGALRDLLDELREPALIFVEYHTDRTAVAAAAQAVGMTSLNIKSAGAIDKWLEGEVDFLVAHPVEAAYGLNLQTQGRVVIWYALPWSLEAYEQGNARVYRYGQKRSVLIVHMAASGTVDSQVSEALRAKKEVTTIWQRGY